VRGEDGALGLADEERRLARRHQAVRGVRAEGGAGPTEVEGTEPAAAEETALAAWLPLAPGLAALFGRARHPETIMPLADALRQSRFRKSQQFSYIRFSLQIDMF
jgi:hypothetical protein